MDLNKATHLINVEIKNNIRVMDMIKSFKGKYVNGTNREDLLKDMSEFNEALKFILVYQKETNA